MAIIRASFPPLWLGNKTPNVWRLFRDAFYTSLWNGLDYTAVTFPVTTVQPEVDVRVPRHQFHNHEDEHVYRWCTSFWLAFSLLSERMAMSINDLEFVDDPHLFVDAPVGLQLVGRTHEEEAVLSMTEVVDSALVRFKAHE